MRSMTSPLSAPIINRTCGPFALAGLNGPLWQITLLLMEFNLGLPRLRGFRKMRAALHRHDFEEAATEAQDSKWAHQTGHRATHITALLRRAAQQ